MGNLLKNVAVKQVLGYYAAGTTKRTSDIVDMQGFDGVMFVAGLGTIIENGTIDVFVEQDTANATTYMARLATTTVHTVTAANATLAKSCIVVDVYRPQERYLQCNITPAVQNAVILGITAILYKTHKAPVTQVATALNAVIKSTSLVEPAEA
jgi:hypothetical protein